MSRRSTIPAPTLAQVRYLAEKEGFKCGDDELEEYRGELYVGEQFYLYKITQNIYINIFGIK